MEEKTISLDILQNLVAESTTTYDPITNDAEWDSLTTSMVSVFQNLEYVSSESVGFTSQRQALLETKMKAMADKQEDINDRMKVTNVRQDITSDDLKAVLELLKKP